LNRRWAALQAAALGQTPPPWRRGGYTGAAVNSHGRRCCHCWSDRRRQTASPLSVRDERNEWRGGELLVASRCNGPVSDSTGTDPACTTDCSPGLALGPSPKRGSFPSGSRTPVLAGTQAGLSAVFGMGTGVDPAAMAASRPTHGVEPWYASVGCVQVRSRLRLDSFVRWRMNGGFDRLVPAG
jgi:hypothetical protein